ncbi:Predicted O-linked N-acetylglucosamine transferase, SPINDLY family [Selenomonas ruminantium]|uniref:Predicted O-linked N-acetylglucosamine transferase, SPINDLY family n=1 Tax=Selenomonas ruminantium TaxID=971 RepID=A0A1M6ULS2_SELRU|nr:hypothetical protein [Selenomonas ruminantium]SHK70195.1 Predicted O-linked N-acetylglucosamine transferase, SPINDLY family [Selenomonas ruminantium]
MSRFVQMFEKMCKAYDAGQYEQAAEIGELTARTLMLTSVQRYYYHEAMHKILIRGGHWQEACKHLERAAAIQLDDELLAERRSFFSEALTWMHLVPDLPDEMLFRMHCLYGSLFAEVQPYRHDPETRQGRKKIKVGYISPDFYEHIVTNFAVQLYAAYDKSIFEVHLYDIGNNRNEVTGWLQEMVDGWHDLQGLSPAEAAARIHADEIDLLVDLAGHTQKGRTLQIMAYKPAPVQLSGIGYFDTTGLPAVDYYLTDAWCDPPGNERFFTETLLRLPRSHFCFTPSESVLRCQKKWQLHTPVVFGSFSNFLKLNDAILTVWRQILERVPKSRLLLKNVRRDKKELKIMKRRLQALGFPLNRVELRPASQYYLDEYQDMDIALDPFPYPGGGTTCEAIYMGVPVISMYGSRHGSRFGYSLLKNMGLEELTVPTPDKYVETAVALAGSQDLLQGLHENLRKMMQFSPIMDVKNYLGDIQAGYEKIYHEWLVQG